MKVIGKRRIYIGDVWRFVQSNGNNLVHMRTCVQAIREQSELIKVEGITIVLTPQQYIDLGTPNNPLKY